MLVHWIHKNSLETWDLDTLNEGSSLEAATLKGGQAIVPLRKTPVKDLRQGIPGPGAGF